MIWILFKMDKGGTQTDGPKNEEIDVDPLGLTL